MLRRLATVICLLALVLTGCGGDDDSDSGADTAARDTTAREAPATTEQRAPGECADVQQPEPKADGGAERPSRALEPGVTYDVTLETSCGEIVIRLDQKTSPRTTASFASLVRDGFFDGTVFHRIVPGFVIQGGDPTGSGTGGPGYSTRDVPPAGTAYTKGTVAMAKTEAEPPGTSGSQFYIVTAPDAGLPPDYALLGKVVEGQRVVNAIGELGDPASGGAGTPLQPVVIERATLSEG